MLGQLWLRPLKVSSIALAGRLKRVSVNFGWDRLKCLTSFGWTLKACLGQLWLVPLKVSSLTLAVTR